jgi:phosphoribosylanthranilate isomerase
MSMTKIKVCGLMREEDATAAAALGADMLGFIHVSGSPRFLDLGPLRRVLDAVPAGVARVIVVQDQTPERLDLLRRELAFDWFQFHGDEGPEHLARWRGYKVFHMRTGSGQGRGEVPPTFGTPFLFDTSVAGKRGGSGKTFDWSVLSGVSGAFMVAGGLDSGNVVELIRTYRPWGVDVCSGIESAPGIKDHSKMAQFIANVRSL